MAPKNIKIIYFNARGRAELCRLILAAAGETFEDIRHTGETWPAEKPNTPFGQLPVLEIDGKRYSQSVAMATYLAREFNLHGDSSLVGLEIDQVVQLVQDYITVLYKSYFEKDEAKKAEMQKNLQEVETPKFFGFFEKILKENGTGYLVGDKLTMADLAVFDVVFNVRKRIATALDSFPLLKELMNCVESNDKIKEYLANRKETDN